jgi:adenylyltransferase/sulfurtransferase
MFNGIGEEGQQKLGQGSAVIIGCGGLGCNIANLLVRAGVGKVRIVDRDFVEYHNLHRQTLFNENDVTDQLPKAVAAQRHLQEINSLVKIEGVLADVNFSNIEKFCSGMDVILDGLDNLETRYLINDVALKSGIPYIYGGTISSLGMTMTLIPGVTPCLRCVFPELTPLGTMPTCETDGVLGTAPAIVGALEATEAIKILVGSESINKKLIILDVWGNSFESVPIAKNPCCPSCNGKYDFLEKKTTLIKSSLCGQSKSIQVVDTVCKKIVFKELAGHLTDVQNLTYNDYVLRFEADKHIITVFSDGRAIITNTLDESLAEKLYLKYIITNNKN